jgi:hypothetical protein
MEDILSKISIGLKSMHATWLGLQVGLECDFIAK